MFRRLNFKTIAILFAVLLILVIAVNIMDNKKNERTFKDDLVEVVADDVTEILLYPKATNGEEVKLLKEDGAWWLVNKDEKYPADNSSASSIISELNRMKPESVVSTSEKRWGQYEVNDSLGSRVILKSGSKNIADVMIGKMAFSQPRKATSYVRLTDDQVVYGVNGYLSMTFNRDLNSFRNKKVVDVKKEDLTRLSFSNPMNGSFTLEKVNEKWMVNSTPADSAGVAEFLTGIQRLNHYTFADDEPVGEPLYSLKIEGNNMDQTVEVKGYPALNEKIVVTTSQNEGNYFDGEGIKDKVFPILDKFLK